MGMRCAGTTGGERHDGVRQNAESENMLRRDVPTSAGQSRNVVEKCQEAAIIEPGTCGRREGSVNAVTRLVLRNTGAFQIR